jgi:sec-independent protein translocase protein TatC
MSEKEMTFIEHIIELRNRLKVVAISFIAALIFWMAFPGTSSRPTPVRS